MIVPLSPNLWFESVRHLREKLVRGERSAEEGVRHFFHLAHLAPGNLASMFDTELTDKKFEKLMRKRGPEALLQSILNAATCEATVQTNGATFEATVRCDAPLFSARFVSEDEAEALLLATLSGLLQLQKFPVNTSD